MSPLCLSYQRLLQTIGVLEAQRTQAILDLEALARHQREALSKPIEFVEQLQKQVTDMHTCFKKRSVRSPQVVSTMGTFTLPLGGVKAEKRDNVITTTHWK